MNTIEITFAIIVAFVAGFLLSWLLAKTHWGHTEKAIDKIIEPLKSSLDKMETKFTDHADHPAAHGRIHLATAERR